MAVQQGTFPHIAKDIVYPESDGKPMADNTLQAMWIIMLYNNLYGLYDGQEVFIAADLFWYPVEGDPHTKVAPDVLIAFDRPPGHRGSYKQWEENNLAPQVVFEIISPSNSGIEMLRKLTFYEKHGVEEFIVLDPEKEDFEAYVSKKGKLVQTNKPNTRWQSSRLGLQFEIREGKLTALLPDGSPMKTFSEIQAEKDAALQEVERLKARLKELGESPD